MKIIKKKKMMTLTSKKTVCKLHIRVFLKIQGSHPEIQGPYPESQGSNPEFQGVDPDTSFSIQNFSTYPEFFTSIPDTTKTIKISSKSGSGPTYIKNKQQTKQYGKYCYIIIYLYYYYYCIFYSMSKNNIWVYCQGCGRSFNGNKNKQGKITSRNLTRYLLSPLGILCQELYKTSGLMLESPRKSGRNKFKLESSTTKK